jgi:phospholipid transport system substrate-binding protein|tara:strand:+ start:680 stop:1282 length:603 start_codon:yes stop_codon:yes gene_type:complete
MSIKRLKKGLFFLIFSFFLSNVTFAISPKDFVQQTVDEAAIALGQNISKELKIVKLKTIANKSVDIEGIGLYSIGKKRKELTDTQKEEYLEIFRKYFLKSFSSRLAQYSNPKIRVDSEKYLNKKYTMVSSVLVATDDKPEVKIDWRVITKDPENPLIIDVIIEGVSLAKVQKEEFNAIIQNNDGDINALFKNLLDFVNKE